jgi:hypothetical protein
LPNGWALGCSSPSLLYPLPMCPSGACRDLDQNRSVRQDGFVRPSAQQCLADLVGAEDGNGHALGPYAGVSILY